MERFFGPGRILLKQGDITDEVVDAVVTAANSSLMGGGGVDGAIHRKGGPRILDEYRQARKRIRGPLPTGEAVITTGGNLQAHFVIHTVGPIFGRSPDPDTLLARAYTSSLEIALRESLETIAVPSISTGAYGFPVERAARIALLTVASLLETAPLCTLREVRFVLFSDDDLRTYEAALEGL